MRDVDAYRLYGLHLLMCIAYVYLCLNRLVETEYPTLSHGNSYVFYEVANSYELFCMISLNPSDG